MLLWPEISRLARRRGSSEIGTLDATRLMNQAATLILDVRDGAEFAARPPAARAPHSARRSWPSASTRSASTRKSPCSSPAQGAAAAALRSLKQAGFTTVYQLKGGLAAWQQASLPVEK